MLRFICFALLTVASLVQGQTTHTATSASWEHVQEKLLLCDPGDTLAIPAGDVEWTRTLIVTEGITIQGAGEGVTIIRDSIRKANGGNSTPDESVFYLSVPEPQVFRMTDLSILPGSPASEATSDGIIQMANSCKAYVFQRLTMLSTTNILFVTQYGSSCYGVIAECTLTIPNQAGNPKRHIVMWKHSSHNGPTGPRINGHGSWESPRDPGTSKFFYMEDNILDSSTLDPINICDGFGGARYVNRFNYCVNKGFGHHGTESAQQYRAPSFTENYCNFYHRIHASSEAEVLDFRDGNGYVWGNPVIGNFTNWIKLNCYRAYVDHYVCYMGPDGTTLWDENDSSDDGSTPGPENVGTGASDGVFEGGTVTGAASGKLTCSGKSWGVNDWRYYVARFGSTFTATGGSTSGNVYTITVAGSPWTPGQWTGYYVTRKDNNQKGRVSATSANTLTLSTNYYRPSFVGYTGDFQLTRSSTITSNTGDELTLDDLGGDGINPVSPVVGQWFEIRRVTRYLDQTGRGQSTKLDPGTSIATSPHQSLGTEVDPSYFWLNNFKGNQYPQVGDWRHQIQEDRDHFNLKSDFNSSPDSGMGAGPIASRPVSGGLLNVAYWATDEGDWNQGFTGTIAATAIEPRQYCEIVSVGTTNFTTIGASSNTVGVQFVASAVGTGTGTVKPAQGQLYRWNGSAWYLAYEPYEYPHPLRDDGATPIPDTTPPTVSSIAVNGATVTVTFSEPVVDGAASQWLFSGGALSAFSGTSASATRTMTTTPSAVNGGTYYASYTAGNIEDAAGNALVSFTDMPVTNNTSASDVTAPTVTSAVVNGDALVLTYSEDVVGVVAGDYSMSGGRTLSNPTGTGNSRSFVVTPPAAFGATYTRTYVAGTTEDVAGNNMVGFTAQAITNSTPDPGVDFTRNPGKKKGKGRVLAP